MIQKQIYKGLSDVKTITKTQYEQVLKTYPVITELYAAIKEFYEILYSRRDERLETWLEKIENFNIPELQTYVNGIRIDINAVKNGIKLKYNNGLAEGSVNKIKVIKRIMYGRNSFDLLKAKGCQHIKVLVLVAAPEGIKALEKAHPDIELYCASIDDHLNEQGYIIPGLGDAGDKIFGTK